MEKKEYTMADLEKEMQEIKIMNRIQTVAVIMIFFFGVSTFSQIFKK